MARQRSYRDPCGIARALDVLGGRWALLVVRELLTGPKRFSDLRAALPSVASDVLAQRLRELDAAGVLRRGTLPPPAASHVYELTERGRAIEPVLLALGGWGRYEPMPDGIGPLTASAMLLALKTSYRPPAATIVALDFGEGRRHIARAATETLVIDGEDDSAPAATIHTDTGTLAELVWRDAPIDDAERRGAVRIDGDRAAAVAFLNRVQLIDSIFSSRAPAGVSTLTSSPSLRPTRAFATGDWDESVPSPGFASCGETIR